MWATVASKPTFQAASQLVEVMALSPPVESAQRPDQVLQGSFFDSLGKNGLLGLLSSIVNNLVIMSKSRL